MKKRIITLVLSALAVVLLVGVGFASWVVSQGDANEQTGNILVETVKDERLHVTVTLISNNENDKKFQFGAPANATEGWLHEDGADPVLENLQVKFQVVVTRDQAFKDENSDGQPDDLHFEQLVFGDKLVVCDENGQVVDGNESEEGIQPQEIAYPTALIQQVAPSYAAPTAGASNWDLSDEGKTATTVVTLQLKWGTLFGGEESVNPYTFFASKEVNGKLSATEVSALTAAGLQWDGNAFTTENTYGDYAVAALRAIYALNQYQFKLTIEVK